LKCSEEGKRVIAAGKASSSQKVAMGGKIHDAVSTSEDASHISAATLSKWNP
jgi:hypothetical protein